VAALARAASAESTATFEITGSFAPAAQGVTVLVELRSRSSVPVTAVRIEGLWRGARARAFLPGPFSPGGLGEARLHFAEAPPRGTTALALLLDFMRVDGNAAARGHEVAALLLAFDAVPSPAVRIATAPVALRESAEAVVRLESTDARPHRIRLTARPPRVLTGDPSTQIVEVPARGTATVRLRIFRARAAPGSDHDLLLIAETDGEPATRTTIVSLAVHVTPESNGMDLARVPLYFAAALLLAWSLYREYRIRA